MTSHRNADRPIRTHRSAAPLLMSAGAALPIAAALSMSLTSPALGQGQAEGDKPRISVSDQMTVDMHVRNEEVTNILEMLAIQSKRNIIASRNVSGKISADLYGVTFFEALDAILHVNGFGYIQKGHFIYVHTTEELEKIQRQIKTRSAKVIRLNYLTAADAAEFVKPLLSEKGGEIKTSTKTESFALPTDVPAGKDDFALGATIVVIDYEENIAAIEKLLAELDTKPAQVLIESTVLQTNLTEDNAFGVDFSIIGSVNFSDFATVGGPRGVAEALGRGTGAGTSGGFSPADNTGTGIQVTPGKSGGPSTMKIGIVSNNVAVIARLLDEVSDTTIVANPKLLVLNRQPARVVIGQRLAYLSTTATETSTTQTVEFLDTGVQLHFRPFVTNQREIRMELRPQISEGTTAEIRGLGGGLVTVPNEFRQEVTTNVIVPDGMTVVIGGMFKEKTVASRSQVPLLGDIPLVGTAFRGHEDSTDREEYIFLVTPTIVSDTVLLDQGERAAVSIDRVRTGTRQGLLPWSREKITSALNVEAEELARNGDNESALWKLNRSLSLNPRQTEAQTLREKILGQREVWPSRELFREVVDDKVARRLKDVTPTPDARQPRPVFDTPIPQTPVDFNKPPAPEGKPVKINSVRQIKPSQSVMLPATQSSPTTFFDTTTQPAVPDTLAATAQNGATDSGSEQSNGNTASLRRDAATLQPATQSNPPATPQTATVPVDGGN